MTTNQLTTKQNEKVVAGLLQKEFGNRWELHPDKFHIFDIWGRGNDGKSALVEVKKRRQLWDDLWIDVAKVEGILERQDRMNVDNAWLIVSVGDEHLVYDLHQIASGEKIKRFMNNRTSEDFHNNNVKVEKEVYEFKANSFFLRLDNFPF